MPSRKEDLQRASEVVSALMKEGLSYVVQQLELKWHLPLISKVFFRPETVPEDLPVRLRRTFERLGGAYLKFGQFLSLRPDLIPENYCNEFKKLLDEVEPFDYAEVGKLIEQAIRRPAGEIFKEIEKIPVGSASIAQVHRATLLNGRKVVLKVQRPNIDKKIEEDMDILYYIAHKAEHSKKLRNLDPVAIVSEFETYAKKELNFIFEAKNIDAFYNIFRHEKKILIPKVHWILTTDKLLVMDYIEGTKLSEIIKNPQLYKQINRKQLAKTIADIMMKQLFDLGIFHADLHPGNILVSDNKIALLDFGIVGTLSKELLTKEIEVYVALIRKDVDGVISGIIKTGKPTESTDLEGFQKEGIAYMKRWYADEMPRRATDVLYNLYLISNKYQVGVPKELMILGKAALTAESCCWALDHDFDFVEYANPKVVEILKSHQTPKEVIRSFLARSRILSQNVYDIPPALLDVLTHLKTGRFSVDMSNTDVRHLGYDVELSSNRLSYSIIMAALLVAGALLVQIGPKYGDFSSISLLSFGLSMFVFGMLMVSVFKEGSVRYDQHTNRKI